MKNILIWTGIVSLGGFFCWLTFYSFYLMLTSKDDNPEPSQKVSGKVPGRKVRPGAHKST